jgi:hypothetical protein
MVIAGKFQQSLVIIEFDSEVVGDARRAGVAGGGVKLFYFRALGYFPGNGVFSGPATDD